MSNANSIIIHLLFKKSCYNIAIHFEKQLTRRRYLMAGVKTSLFSDDVVEEINRIFKHGNTVELKKENGKLVVVEIQRKAKIKTSITG